MSIVCAKTKRNQDDDNTIQPYSLAFGHLEWLSFDAQRSWNMCKARRNLANQIENLDVELFVQSCAIKRGKDLLELHLATLKKRQDLENKMFDLFDEWLLEPLD